MFMEEYAVNELGLDKAIRLSYDLMGLQSFFTVGEDEVRAWTIKRGATAVEAAAAIHSDLAKGFIRAETVSYDDLIALGGLPQARNAGKLRQEGKSIIMIEHRLKELFRIADRVIVLNFGEKIADGKAADSSADSGTKWRAHLAAEGGGGRPRGRRGLARLGGARSGPALPRGGTRRRRRDQRPTDVGRGWG